MSLKRQQDIQILFKTQIFIFTLEEQRNLRIFTFKKQEINQFNQNGWRLID